MQFRLFIRSLNFIKVFRIILIRALLSQASSFIFNKLKIKIMIEKGNADRFELPIFYSTIDALAIELRISIYTSIAI